METLHIFKIGGNVIDDQLLLEQFLADFGSVLGPKILIHGGGKKATTLAETLGIPQTMVDGRRITDAATLDVAVMVYAGLINKKIVARLQAIGCCAGGFSGADLNLVKANRRNHPEIDYGYVGDIPENGVNRRALAQLLEANRIPVFCAITHDGEGNLLNTNADTMAAQIAVAMARDYDVKLIYCFEKNGVLTDISREDSVLAVIDPERYEQLKADLTIAAGMIPKLDNAFNALENGVKQVRICHAGSFHSGTELVPYIHSEQHSAR